MVRVNLDETVYDSETRVGADLGRYGTWLKAMRLFVIGLYHPVGEALSLVLEYSDSESEAHNGNQGEEDTIAIGAIMFF